MTFLKNLLLVLFQKLATTTIIQRSYLNLQLSTEVWFSRTSMKFHRFRFKHKSGKIRCPGKTWIFSEMGTRSGSLNSCWNISNTGTDWDQIPRSRNINIYLATMITAADESGSADPYKEMLDWLSATELKLGGQKSNFAAPLVICKKKSYTYN